MANFRAISAVGQSIERFLNHCFAEQEPISDVSPTSAVLIRTEDLDSSETSPNGFTPPALTIVLYKIDINSVTRAAWSAVGHERGRAHLPLDLHFLLTPWASNAANELAIIGRAMECLEVTPTLTGPMLDNSAEWSPHDGVELCLEDLTTEDVMRTFDSLPVNFKLSVCYLARVVRIDSRDRREHPRVLHAETGLRPETAS